MRRTGQKESDQRCHNAVPFLFQAAFNEGTGIYFRDYFSYKIGEDNQQCDGDALVFQGTQCVLLRNEKESDQIRLVVNKICKGPGNGRFRNIALNDQINGDQIEQQRCHIQEIRQYCDRYKSKDLSGSPKINHGGNKQVQDESSKQKLWPGDSAPEYSAAQIMDDNLRKIAGCSVNHDCVYHMYVPYIIICLSRFKYICQDSKRQYVFYSAVYAPFLPICQTADFVIYKPCGIL